jgi:hypothetical protein
LLETGNTVGDSYTQCRQSSSRFFICGSFHQPIWGSRRDVAEHTSCLVSSDASDLVGECGRAAIFCKMLRHGSANRLLERLPSKMCWTPSRSGVDLISPRQRHNILHSRPGGFFMTKHASNEQSLLLGSSSPRSYEAWQHCAARLFSVRQGILLTRGKPGHPGLLPPWHPIIRTYGASHSMLGRRDDAWCFVTPHDKNRTSAPNLGLDVKLSQLTANRLVTDRACLGWSN